MLFNNITNFTQKKVYPCGRLNQLKNTSIVLRIDRNAALLQNIGKITGFFFRNYLIFYDKKTRFLIISVLLFS